MASDLTLPDLVVLSLLAERPMHGYELNQELERRDARDWAGISRPQVYYSLKKLAGSGHLVRAQESESRAGPERQIFRLSAAGKRALSAALAREDWALQRPPPPFLTWLSLSHNAAPEDRLRLIRRRRAFLEEQLAREKETLGGILADTGPMIAMAEQVIRLVIAQWEVEVRWLEQLERSGFRVPGSAEDAPGHEVGAGSKPRNDPADRGTRSPEH